MNKKDRILELVDKKILTLDEALILLEQLEPNTLKANKPINKKNQIEDSDKEDDAKEVEIEELMNIQDTLSELAYFEEAYPEDIRNNDPEYIALKEKLEQYQENKMSNETSEQESNQEDMFEGPEYQSVKEKVLDATETLSSFVKETVSDVVDTVQKNVEWKDFNLKLPGLISHKFEYILEKENIEAALIDIKVAYGSVTLHAWDRSDIKMMCSGKIYGKLSHKTAVEDFLSQTTIDIRDEQLSIQIPSKRMKVDTVLYVPKHLYHHLSLNVLNGSITVNQLECVDSYIKNTHGSIHLLHMNAELLEISGVNSNVNIEYSHIKDFIGDTVNGDFTLKSNFSSVNISSLNGDVRYTNEGLDLKVGHIQLVNGTIKVSVAEQLGLECQAQAKVGTIKTRLIDYEVIQEKVGKVGHQLLFRKLGTTEWFSTLNLVTQSGNILFKSY